MKHTGKAFLFFTVLGFLTTGCVQFSELAMPTKLQVKTTAEYNFTIMDFEKDFSEYISVEKIRELSGASGDNAPFEIYDYNPGQNQSVQQFLIRMPLQEIPIDIGSYFESVDIGKNLNAMEIDQSFEIPAFNIQQSQTIDISELNKMVIPMIIVTGTTGVGNQIVDFTNFDSVVVKKGVLTVRTTATGRVELYSGNGLTNSTCSESTRIASGTINHGQVSFNLDGKTLYGKGHTFINFLDDATGESFTGMFSDLSTQFAQIKGLTAENQDFELDPIEFPGAGDESPVKNCVFSSGSTMTLSVKTPGWSTGIIDKNIKMEGGLDLTFTGTDEDITKPLDSKSYNNETIRIIPKMVLKFNNATIDLTKNPVFEIKSDIKGFDSVTAKLPDGMVTSFSTPVELPEMAKKIIKEIVWKEGSGIKIKYTNTLPDVPENKMTLDASSTFIDFSGSEEIVPTGKTEVKVIEYKSAGNTVPIDNSTTVDFNASLTIPGYNSSTNTFTIKQVKPGEKYRLYLNIQPVLDWESIKLDLSSLGDSTKVDGKITMDINPVSLLSAVDSALNLTGSDRISKKVKIDSLPVKIFCEKPSISVFNDISFKGKLSLGGTTGSDTLTNEKFLLGTSSTTQIMNLYKEPVLEKNAKGEVINDVSKALCLGTNLADSLALLSDTESLAFKYSLALSGTNSSLITIKQDDLKNAPSTSMKIVAYVILPLTLNVTEDCPINILGIMGQDFSTGPDLLGRDSDPSSSSEALDKYLRIIESVGLSYVPSKKPFIGSAEMQIDLDGAGGAFTRKSISLDGGVYSERPADILNNYVRPEINLCLKKGKISFPREMAFKTRIDLKIKTNGEPLEFEFGGN
ncbi:MAG: hypothetical protein MJ179_05635 [Treponema sp.]|nr:hypothetical protein [Treponema sp.]